MKETDMCVICTDLWNVGPTKHKIYLSLKRRVFTKYFVDMVVTRLCTFVVVKLLNLLTL